MRGTQKRIRREGFSLAELLVVVAIIMILIALLMPIFADRKNRATQLHCQSNLRELFQVLTYAAAEENGRFGMGNSRNPYTLVMYSNPGQSRSDVEVFDSIMRSMGIPHSVWYCPNLTLQVPEIGPHKWMVRGQCLWCAGDEFNIGYGFIAPPDYVSRNKFTGEIADEDDLVHAKYDVMVDVCVAHRPPDAEPEAVNIPFWRTFPHHGIDNPESSNVLHGDGSVERRPIEELRYRYRYYHAANFYW